MKRIKKIVSLTILAGIAAGTLGLTGCGEKPEDTGAVASADSGKAAVVNIGTMNLVNGDLIAQYEKLYEAELGVDVKIINFDSGKDVNTALASGSIDISELGSSPSALGISSSVDYEVFWIGDIIGSAESLVVKNDSGIESVGDLKGKKAATPFASTAHYSLLNALKLEGVSENDVTLLDLQPDDIFAAWQRGDIDAAYVWYPVLSNLLEDGKVITHSEELADKGIITADLNVVRTEFAEKNPEIVTNYVKIQLKANDILLNDPDKAADEISDILEISREDAADQITQFKYLTADEQIDYLTNKIPDTLKNTADFLVEQGSIKSAPDAEIFKSKVTTEFIEAAVK
ncbi:MAG: aliphatic sulfonate ABC transporter substrate-binding protein [Oscillospiraceae bacterium]